MVVVCVLGLAGLPFGGSLASAATPRLVADESYGSAGTAATSVPSSSETIRSAVDDSGRLTVVGISAGRVATITRLRADGQPDTTLLGTGSTVLAGSTVNVTVLRDGGFLAAGGSGGIGTIVKYRSDGTPDPAFGTGGTAAIADGGGHFFVAFDATPFAGGIAVTGFASSPTGTFLAVLDTAGHLVAGFGSAGIALQPGDDAPSAVYVQPAAGRILRCGPFHLDAFSLATGTPDGSFADHGSLDTVFSGCDRLALNADDSFFIAGPAGDGSGAVERHWPNGQLDPTFGAAPFGQLGLGDDINAWDGPMSLARLADGTFLFAAPGETDAGPTTALVRLSATGDPDPTWSDSALAQINIDGIRAVGLHAITANRLVLVDGAGVDIVMRGLVRPGGAPAPSPGPGPGPGPRRRRRPVRTRRTRRSPRPASSTPAQVSARPSARFPPVAPLMSSSRAAAAYLNSGATAVVLNVTAADAAGPGFIQVVPTGGAAIGSSSSLNVERAGQTIPNLVIVPVGANGSVTFYSQSGTQLVADVFGYFSPSTRPAAGRYQPLAPTRLLDTRGGTQLQPGVGRQVTVAGTSGVGIDASAVVLNVTATEATAPGFIQVVPTGGPAFGASSNLNFEAGDTIPNLVIVPVGPDGSVTLYSYAAADVIVDVEGWFTGAQSALGTDGLFVPLTPARIYDSRTGTRPGVGDVRVVQAAGVASIPVDAIGVALNVTATEASAPGFVHVFPAGEAVPGSASNLNLQRGGQTIPNAVITKLNDAGAFALYTQSGTHLIADASGYFTAATE